MSLSSVAGLLAFFAILYVWLRKFNANGTLPPGPRPLPVLGNIRDLKAKEPWFAATQWAKRYGEVVYLNVMGMGFVFLSGQAISDLLDKKASVFSDRPHFIMVGELCGCDQMVVFTPYGDRMKRQRKLMQKALGVQHIPEYHPLLEKQTQPFLQRLLDNPSGLMDHVRRYAGGLILSVVYGYKIESEDKYLALAEECVDIILNDITSGGVAWPVDIIPALKYLPSWFPGAGFKRNAIKWKAKMEELADKPFEFFKASMADGTAIPSFCSTLFGSETEHTPQFESDAKWTANSMYFASMDTTITTVSHFVLAMMDHPECLARAQKEIDSIVVGRLPTFNDRPHLPYVECIMSECFRWAVPIPLNLPHRVMEDEIYCGMRIPKGSMIFANVWATLRDEKMYPNPDTFYPERFLKAVDEETRLKHDPRSYIFGFGRRKCPGSHLVESSIWLLIVSMLATLDISKAVDDSGHVVEPEVRYDNSVFRIPNSFQCKFTARSKQAARLISQKS